MPHWCLDAVKRANKQVNPLLVKEPRRVFERTWVWCEYEPAEARRTATTPLSGRRHLLFPSSRCQSRGSIARIPCLASHFSRGMEVKTSSEDEVDLHLSEAAEKRGGQGCSSRPDTKEGEGDRMELLRRVEAIMRGALLVRCRRGEVPRGEVWRGGFGGRDARKGEESGILMVCRNVRRAVGRTAARRGCGWQARPGASRRAEWK